MWGRAGAARCLDFRLHQAMGPVAERNSRRSQECPLAARCRSEVKRPPRLHNRDSAVNSGVALEWCMSSDNQQRLRGEFGKIMHVGAPTQGLDEALIRVGAEAKSAGCLPEELLILVREAWSQSDRPPTIGEEAWSRVYHQALATCLTAYFSNTGGDASPLLV